MKLGLKLTRIIRDFVSKYWCQNFIQIISVELHGKFHNQTNSQLFAVQVATKFTDSPCVLRFRLAIYKVNK